MTFRMLGVAYTGNLGRMLASRKVETIQTTESQDQDDRWTLYQLLSASVNPQFIPPSSYSLTYTNLTMKFSSAFAAAALLGVASARSVLIEEAEAVGPIQFSNCGKPSDSAVVEKIEISPNPPQL